MSISRMQLLHFIQKSVNFPHCSVCPMSKQTLLHFPLLSSFHSFSCFDLLHVAIWGPFHVCTYKGEKYFLTLVDDFSKATWVYLMQSLYNTSLGIVHQSSCPYTPQQNGVVKRKHRHILDVSQALRFQSSLPLQFLGECVLTSCYLINRTPSPLLNNDNMKF